MPSQPTLGKSGTRQYHRAIPYFWSDAATTSHLLFPTAVSLKCASRDSKPFAPVLILTRRPLPELEDYNSFLGGIPAITHLVNAAPITLESEQLRLLGLFTVRLCRTITNKPFVCKLDDILYFFAPLAPMIMGEEQQMSPMAGLISWDIIIHSTSTWTIPIDTESLNSTEQDIQDAILQDRSAEFTRRFEVVALRRDLTPHSQIIESPNESGFISLLDAIKSRSRSFSGLSNDMQPIIEASVMEPHINYLNPMLPQSRLTPATKYLIPEICNRLTLPASVLRTALILPSVLYKVNCLLVAKELNRTIFNDVLSETLLEIAITCPSTCVEFDYERLELLGDAYLKYVTSVYIVACDPRKAEREMHAARQRMVNNNTLTQKAIRIGLPMYIQSRPFVPRSWTPHNFAVKPSSNDLLLEDTARQQARLDTSQLSEKDGAQEEQNHWLADKTIADAMEAVIGAAYLSEGEEAAYDTMKSLGLSFPSVDDWPCLQRKISGIPCPTLYSSNSQKSTISQIEGLLGLKLGRPGLLSQALVRADIAICNALEFIGDAILDLLVARHTFERESKLSAGGLSLLKAAMISNSTLAAVLASSRLVDVISGVSTEMRSINAYSNILKVHRNNEYNEAKTAKRPPGQFWRGIEPPKLLATLLKSMIGGLYLSESPSSAGVESFFEKLMKPFFDEYITITTLSHRPTAAFVELLRAHGCHVFDIKKENTHQTARCQVLVHGHVLGNAEDLTMPYAVISACRSALNSLESNPGILSAYCDCRSRPHKKIKDKNYDQLLGLGEQ